VKNRDKWTHAIGAKKYDMGADSLVWGEGDKVDKDSLLDLDSRPNSPDQEAGKRDSGASTSSNSEMRGLVRQMAAAILQVGQMITEREKFLKEPLGENEKERKKRLKREEDEKKRKELQAEAGEEEEEEDEEEVEVKVIMTAFKRWEKSLMASTNFGQLFIHLTTLDNSIVWSKSILNTKCKVCRRKTDSDNMLLCDSCDNGHHIYCLKPKLKAIPSGDWFCPECRPKERVRSPKKKVRRTFSQTEDSEEDPDETPPKKKGKSKKKLIESDEEEEEELPKKRGKSRKKVVESEEEESEDELPKKKGGKKKEEGKSKKKGGLANLLSKRGAAKKAEKQMKGLDDTHEEEEEEDSDDEDTGRRGKRNKKSQDENKENARVKRARNLDDSFDLNTVALEDLVKGLIKHKDGWPFDRPITKADAPDYHLCVRNPMDLGTVKSRLNDMQYTSNQEVVNDIRLVFSNCYSYNMEDTEEYGCAERLEKFFDSQLKAQGIVDEEAPKPKAKKRRF